MKSLVSLNGCYEDFCKDFELKLQNTNKNVLAGILYGDNCHLPLKPKQVAVYLDINSEARVCLPFIQYVENHAEYEGYTFVVIAAKKSQRKLFAESDALKVCLVNSAEAMSALAVSGYILTERSLPTCFVRRKGQKVTALFDETQQKKTQNDILSRSACARSLIQTTGIVVDTKARKDYLFDAFDLDEIGQGQVVVLPEGETYQKSLTEYVLNGSSQTAEIYEYGKQSKKKILLSVKWGADLKADNMVKSLSDLLTAQGYKVYLLLQRPEDLSKLPGIKGINQKVLLLFQGWVFSKGRQELMDIRYLISDLFLFEEVSAALAMLQKKGMELENRRLFGKAEFESFLYIGNVNRLLLAVTTGVSAKTRIKVETESPAECQCRYQQRNNGVQIYNNMTEAVDLLFDKIVFLNTKSAESAKETGRYSENKVAVYHGRKAWERTAAEYDWEELGLSKRRYVIYEKEESFARNIEIKMLPLPQKGRKAFLVHSEMTDSVELVRRFALSELCREGAELFVFGSEAGAARTEGSNLKIEDQILPVEGAYPENIPFPEKYMSLFDGYLSVDGESENRYCPVRLGMEFMGGQVLRIREDGSIYTVEKPVFADLSEYETACRKELLELLECV